MSGITEPSQLLVSVKEEVKEESEDFQEYLTTVVKVEEEPVVEHDCTESQSPTLTCKEEKPSLVEIKVEDVSDLRDYGDDSTSPSSRTTTVLPDPPLFLASTSLRSTTRKSSGTHSHKCSVIDCEDQHKSLHRSPAVQDRRAEWIQFIFDGRVPATVGKNLLVCANHFKADCFTNLGQYNAGLATRLFLKEGSFPTVRGRPADEGDACTSLQLPATRDIGCQTDLPQRRTVGTQLSLKTLQPHVRSEAVQATASCKDAGVGTSTVPLTAPLPFISSVPSKRPRLDQEEEHPLEASSSAASSQGLVVESVTALTEPPDMLDVASTPTHETRKYTVYETCIMELFELCPVCRRVCTVQTGRLGTFLSVEQQCSQCQFSRTWKSQPLPNNTPAGNT